jgi:hypothetical protein
MTADFTKDGDPLLHSSSALVLDPVLAQSIWERAKERGYDPKVLRDAVLAGTAHASWMLPAVASTMAMGPGGEPPPE